VVDPTNPRFDQHPKSFNRIGVYVAAHVNTIGCELRALHKNYVLDAAVCGKFIGVDHTFLYDMLANERIDAVSRHATKSSNGRNGRRGWEGWDLGTNRTRLR
jgi:hypothetical protein